MSDNPYQEALRVAHGTLRADANELALLSHQPVWALLPARAQDAIQREIDRLRDVAEHLARVPVPDPEDIPDQYGNTEREPFKYCSFPDCGCDGARLCQAQNGANAGASALNYERGGGDE